MKNTLENKDMEISVRGTWMRNSPKGKQKWSVNIRWNLFNIISGLNMQIKTENHFTHHTVKPENKTPSLGKDTGTRTTSRSYGCVNCLSIFQKALSQSGPQALNMVVVFHFQECTLRKPSHVCTPHWRARTFMTVVFIATRAWMQPRGEMGNFCTKANMRNHSGEEKCHTNVPNIPRAHLCKLYSTWDAYWFPCDATWGCKYRLKWEVTWARTLNHRLLLWIKCFSHEQCMWHAVGGSLRDL